MDIPLRPLVSKPSQPNSRLRNLFTPSGKDKLTPELRHALSLLRLRDLESLENHFLALDAFLKPWAQYRDTFLLLRLQNPTAQTEATTGITTAEPGAAVITKPDILWFYTYFMLGDLRYDARADEGSESFTYDETQYGFYDRSQWGQAEYEKRLYSWLLQEFKVGRRRNPYGFRYFELQNICSAWELVFLPIVNAVRDSYDVKGRKYYGRLATFIEDRSPSRLAFPQSNISGIPGQSSLATPTRMMSFSRTGQRIIGSGQDLSTDARLPRERSFITVKDMAEVDAELRNLSEKYGGVVERPRFKKNLKDWLSAQKERAKQRSATRGESPLFGCQGIDVPRSPTQMSFALRTVSCDSSRDDRSPISPLFPPSVVSSDSDTVKKSKRKKLKQLVPFGMYGYRDSAADEPSPKSPYHGVTRFVEIPGSSGKPNEETTHQRVATEAEEQPWTKSASLNAGPTFQCNSSDAVYMASGSSNPSTEGNMAPHSGPMLEENTDGISVYSTMGPPSAIPDPLFKKAIYEDEYEEIRAGRPSYEGNEYEHAIPPSFVVQKMQEGLGQVQNLQQQHQPDRRINGRPSRALEPLPSFHRAKFAAQSTESIPEHTAWPGEASRNVPPQSPSRSSPFDDADNDSLYAGPPPPIPAKSPRRSQSLRVSVGSYMSASSSTMSPMPDGSLARSSSVRSGEANPVTSESSLAPLNCQRIISRENIRARLALSGNTFSYSYSSSEESLAPKVGPGKTAGQSTANRPPVVRKESDGLNNAKSQGEGEGEGEGDDENSPTNPSRSFHTFNKHFFPRKDLGQDCPNVSAEYKF